MLIRFSVENFLSFCDEVEFSMLAGNGRKHPQHIIKPNKPNNLRVLKAGVIYGANAAGKSNLVKAMAYARERILRGARPNQRLPFNPYRFSKECLNKPSTFKFEFSIGDSSYAYGFSLDATRIHEEWLYEITASSERPIFERETSQKNDTKIDFNIKFENNDDEDFLRFTARGTRPNQLFLTETIERNMKHFAGIYDWFRHALVIIYPDSKRKGLSLDFMAEDNFKQRFGKLLRQFDTGIAGIELQPIELDNEPTLQPIVEEIRQDMFDFADSEPDGIAIPFDAPTGQKYLFFASDGGEIQSWKMMTVHEVEGQDTPIYMEVSEESDGTQRLFDIIPGLMELMEGEKVFIIDELDRSLHPKLTRSILELFLQVQGSKSQLIVTTHESSLLDLDLLRRDEVWFIEKSVDGKSEAYSLEEYTPRHDKNIRKGYLQGRYGALPFIKTELAANWTGNGVKT